MNITVYCGALAGADPEYTAKAAELGRWMAENGHRLIYGAGNAGMMGAVSQGILSAGGEAVGVTPDFFVYAEETRTDLTELILTQDLPERRIRMIELGDAFIALPGGTGTLDEISEVMSLRRLGKLGKRIKPVMLYNINGYYDELFEFFGRIADEGFCRRQDIENIGNVRCIDDIARMLETAGSIDAEHNNKYSI